MSLQTLPVFIFDYQVTSTSQFINFDEGGPELTAVLNIGSYSLTDYLSEIERAMNAAGALDFTVTANRDTRIITVAATGTFSLLITSGSNAGASAYANMGFSGADVSGSSSYDGGAAAGNEYIPQFFVQNYTSFDDFKVAADASVNVAASGNTEVLSFGQNQFMRANITFATSRDVGANCYITNNATGVADLRTFMDYLITKGPVEFSEDKDSRSTFTTCILEATPENGDGVGYRLNELVARRLEGFFETGTLLFRKV